MSHRLEFRAREVQAGVALLRPDKEVRPTGCTKAHTSLAASIAATATSDRIAQITILLNTRMRTVDMIARARVGHTASTLGVLAAFGGSALRSGAPRMRFESDRGGLEKSVGSWPSTTVMENAEGLLGK